MSYHGRFEQQKQPKKKRGWKVFLIILAVILVSLVVLRRQVPSITTG